VESSCELGNEPSGSIKCWELPSSCTTCDLSSGTQLHRVSYEIEKVVEGEREGERERERDIYIKIYYKSPSVRGLCELRTCNRQVAPLSAFISTR
jgi:hypothetical protein